MPITAEAHVAPERDPPPNWQRESDSYTGLVLRQLHFGGLRYLQGAGNVLGEIRGAVHLLVLLGGHLHSARQTQSHRNDVTARRLKGLLAWQCSIGVAAPACIRSGKNGAAVLRNAASRGSRSGAQRSQHEGVGARGSTHLLADVHHKARGGEGVAHEVERARGGVADLLEAMDGVIRAVRPRVQEEPVLPIHTSSTPMHIECTSMRATSTSGEFSSEVTRHRGGGRHQVLLMEEGKAQRDLDVTKETLE
eukprot:5011419-Pyramimonas_sp.AAC.1